MSFITNNKSKAFILYLFGFFLFSASPVFAHDLTDSEVGPNASGAEAGQNKENTHEKDDKARENGDRKKVGSRSGKRGRKPTSSGKGGK